MPASAPSYAESYGARVANFFRGASSPRRDPERRQKGGRYDASRSPPLADTCPPPLDNVNTRSPPLDATVYGGRSRGPATSFVLVIVLLVIIVVVIRFLMFGLMVFGGCGGPPGCCCCFCL